MDKALEIKYQQTLKTLAKYKRVAYLPQVALKSQPNFDNQSKIGGFPYLRHEDDWPTCPNCKQHMQLFLQINGETMPVKPFEGLLQLFYCSNTTEFCDEELNAFEAFSKGVVCRKIETGNASAIIEPWIEDLFEEKQIIAWDAKEDYPHFETYAELDIEIEDEVWEMMEERGEGVTIDKDKLFGWPYWVQGEEYPNDRKTNTQMEYVFQLVSEDNLHFLFGDMGIGHLTQSPDDADELAFAWACY